MDAHTFDRWVAGVARHPTRRTALRLLAGSLVAGLVAHRRAAPARVQGRPDRDGDGLYDDDEVEVYGTNPDNPDSDCDGVLDGPEIYYGTNPLGPPGCVPACPAGQARCLGMCVDVTADPSNCGGCGGVCAAGETCLNGACGRLAPSDFCAPMGLTSCGEDCVDTFNNSSNCGACGNACAGGDFCAGGACQRGCLALGTACTYGVDECCGGACLFGICQCSPSRDVCSNGSTCCSGVCGGDGFCF